MAQTPADPVFQIPGIPPVFQHFLIVIRLQYSGMALLKMSDNIRAEHADIGKNAYAYPPVADGKTMWITSIVIFPKGPHLQLPEMQGLCRGKSTGIFQDQPAFYPGFRCNVYRKPVFPGQDRYTPDMIAMLMGDQNGPDMLHIQARPAHSSLGFSAGDPGIYQDGILLIADIVAISVAAGV